MFEIVKEGTEHIKTRREQTWKRTEDLKNTD